MSYPILLYDGVCGLCNRFVQFILLHDRNAIFRFAPLQGPLGERILSRHGIDSGKLSTLYVVLHYELADERVLLRSDAVLFVLNELERPWRLLAFSLKFAPRFLRDGAYNALARQRYRIFGRSETCVLPRGQDHSRFLDG